MRGSFIFLGVSLCVLLGGSFNESSFSDDSKDAFWCGSKICERYCSALKYLIYSENISRTEYYEEFIADCQYTFTKEMNATNSSGWCVWDKVKSHYNRLTQCTEAIADCLLLPWPNKPVEKIFVDMHTLYFQDCPTQTLRDPPPNVVFALVMTPICLIPAMVVLVVLKTKNGDRRP